MGKNWNLVNAQKLFADITGGRVDAFHVEQKVEDMHVKLEQVRANGQPDLGIQALDAQGKMSAQQVEEALSQAVAGAKLERGVKNVRHILGTMQASEKAGETSPDHVYENVARTLKEAGANTDIFTRGYQPALVEIDAVLKKYEGDIAAKKAKPGQSR